MIQTVFPLNSWHRKTYKKTEKTTNMCQAVAERGPSLWIAEAGGHLGFWKMLKGELNSPGRFGLCDAWSCRIEWEKNYIRQVRVCSPGCLTNQAVKADFKAEPLLDWYSFFLTWFCSSRHHINNICLVNWAHPWAFCKIQDGVQDGHQLQGFTRMDLILQSSDKFWWSLGLFICFPWCWIQWKHFRKYQLHVSWWNYHYKQFWCCSPMTIFMKKSKITLMDRYSLVWLAWVTVWQTNKIWRVNLV